MDPAKMHIFDINAINLKAQDFLIMCGFAFHQSIRLHSNIYVSLRIALYISLVID